MNITDWISLISLAATFAMAVATTAMALYTKRLADATRKSIEATCKSIAVAQDSVKQAERHHQQSLRPCCVIEDRGTGRIWDLFKIESGWDISLVVRNQGLGPCSRMKFQFSHENGAPIGNGDEIDDRRWLGVREERILRLSVAPKGGTEEMTIRVATGLHKRTLDVEDYGKPFAITICFEDLFGNRFKTVYKGINADATNGCIPVDGPG